MAEKQIDFLETADQRSRLRRYLASAAERFGIDLLAHQLDLDDSTLRNQLGYRKRTDKGGVWRPSFDAFVELWIADQRFRRECLAVCDETIEEVEHNTPEQSLREIVAMAEAGEFGREATVRIKDLYRRTKKGGLR